EGIDEPLLLIPLGAVRRAPPGQPLAASNAWALIALEGERDAASAIRDFARWRSGVTASRLAAREVAALELWRVRPTVRFRNDKERHLWRQSEVMLRIAQSREPDRADRTNLPGRRGNGLSVASLPEGAWLTLGLRVMGCGSVAFVGKCRR